MRERDEESASALVRGGLGAQGTKSTVGVGWKGRGGGAGEEEKRECVVRKLSRRQRRMGW